MSVKETKLRTTSSKNEKKSVLDIAIHRSRTQKNVPFIKEKNLPAGKYTTRITAVFEATTENAEPAVDVCYQFTNPKGEMVEAKERYVLDSYYFEKLGDALIDAGLPDGATIAEAIGLEERVTVAYPHKGALGRIQQRKPHKRKDVTPLTSAASEDDLEEEVLVEENDDDFDFDLDED